MARKQNVMNIKMHREDTGAYAETWKVWREPRVFNVGGNLKSTYTGPMWCLGRPDGNDVGLEPTWADSVRSLKSKANAYGFTCNVD